MLGMYHSQLSEGNDRDGTSFYNVSKPKTDLGGISVASERSQRRDEATPINVDEILPPPPTTNEPLNVVLLYADDWSFSTLGAMGNTVVKTPALDALAAKGVLFSHNCVVTSVCMQSRATLYTGQYSSRHQFFGKYHHLEPPPRDVPTFTEYRSYPYDHFVKKDDVTKHITEWNEIDGLNFLERRPKDEPFFLTVSFFATHAEDGSEEQYRPMESSEHLYANDTIPRPKTFTEQHWAKLPPFFDENNVGRVRFHQRYDTPEMYQSMMKKTYRMATEVDTSCGKIINKLEEQGVMNNTLIIFTTDNGNIHGQQGLAEKWYAYEESMRVPLIIYDPRMPKSNIGTKNEEFTLNIDLAPTILSAAGVTPPSVMQGRDISDLYLRSTTSPPWRQEFLYEFWDNSPVIPNSMALVRKGFKYIHWTDNDYHQAFDLENDPFEEKDLLGGKARATYAHVTRRLKELQKSARIGMPL